MTALHEVISTRREAIMKRWTAGVSAVLGVSAVPPMELRDHLPLFLDQMATALRRNAEMTSDAAEEHGEQRLRLGFSVGSVVREYGVLRQCILSEAEAAAVEPGPWEHRILNDLIISGIADAVTEYARQRDAELQ